jgi:hypothetical protein
MNQPNRKDTAPIATSSHSFLMTLAEWPAIISKILVNIAQNAITYSKTMAVVAGHLHTPQSALFNAHVTLDQVPIFITKEKRT